VIPRAIRWNWPATTAACKGRSNDTLKERLTRYRQIMTLSGRRSHKNNPRLDLTGVEFRGEAAMKFQAAILLSVCLTLSAWSQLTFTVPVVDKSDSGSPLEISGTATFTEQMVANSVTASSTFKINARNTSRKGIVLLLAAPAISSLFKRLDRRTGLRT